MLRKGFEKESPARFVIVFLTLFAIFYYFNIFFFGITSPGRHYNAFLATYFNYISWLRYALLSTSTLIIREFGFTTLHNNRELLVAGRGVIVLVYTCLGLGIMSFFAAFVIAYPKRIKSKLIFLVLGLFVIQFLNVLRFVLLAIFWDKKSGMTPDHHTIFNIIIYILIAISLYFWVKYSDHKLQKKSAEN